jgi:predicted kinase
MRFIDLQEGPNDPGIFKAIFLAGGPGSGKSYVAQQLGLQARGLKVLNSDDAFEYLMRKHDLSFEMPPEEQPERDVVRARAKKITSKKQDIYLGGRLGLIIDGTAKDPGKMAKLKTELEAIGYQTMMVFVNTSLRTALQRNLLRPRKVPADIVTQSHKLVQANKEQLADVFAPNYVEINNNENPNFNEPLKRVEKFIDAPVTPMAKDWISKAQLQKTVAQEDVQSKPKVYVDMDGVIANFYAGVTRVTGHAEPRELALQDMEDTMASFKGTNFFYQLPKYEQADQLIALVNKMTGGDWYILSSPLKYDREGSAKHKAAWIRDKLKIQPKGMHFTGDKAQYAVQPDGTPNILIDDYPKYLNSWKDKGGIGVQYKGHVGNIEDVKATLDKYLGADVDETIRKVKGGYRLLSKKGKNLGTYPSKAGAEKREREVQYFKHMGEDNKLLDNPILSVAEFAEKPDYYDRLETVEEGPKDFDDMKLDAKGKQDSIDYFYKDHAPSMGKPVKAGKLGSHDIVTVTKGPTTLMFLVDANDSAVFYVGFNKYQDGVAIGNVRSNGTVKATDVYAYLVKKYGKLYSDKHQTPSGRKIWDNLSKYTKLKVTDVGDRLMATENFADGKVKGKSRPGRVKKAGASCKGSVTDLRAKAKKYSGEKGKMYHWCANMKGGKK